MEILKLKLYTSKFREQIHFYRDILGFRTVTITDHGFSIQAGQTLLIFQKSSQNVYYHFAFLIPTHSIDDAIQFLTRRHIAILKYHNKNIIDFGTGRAVYFRDANENIVEFIERPCLKYTRTKDFSIDQVIKINEIGLPSEDTIEMSQKLIDSFNIQLINREDISEKFCWIGDHNGAFIVTKKGRSWLPTNSPGIINDFCIEFNDANQSNAICFKGNIFAKWHE